MWVDTRTALRAGGAAIVLGATALGHTATIVERSVELELEGPAMVERLHLVVALEEVGDLVAWSEYSISFDDDIELVEASARVLSASGEEVEPVPRRRWREETSTGFGLHSSQRTVTIPFPKLDVGQQLEVRAVRRHTPAFPTHSVLLQLGTAQRRLWVRVRKGDQPLRWLGPDDDRFRLAETSDGISLEATDVPRRETPRYAGSAWSASPMLRLAWDQDPGWESVGRWYTSLTAGVERDHTEVASVAARVAGGLDDPQARLDALSAWVKHTIRYEAVEIGIGGLVPTPAHEVLQRGWGDCKDMSELLAELLRAVGIPARLTLVNLGHDVHLDARFPAGLQFNHCIVAVPQSALGEHPLPGLAGEWLVVDPTMDRGGPTWLSPSVQGQWAVVAAGDDSELIQIPVLADLERTDLLVAARLDAQGSARGQARYTLTGSGAVGWLRSQDAVEPERIEESIRESFQRALPGATVGSATWQEEPGEVPAVQIEATVTVPGIAQGSAERRRLRLPSLTPLPESRELDDRREAIVLRPGLYRTTWQLRLPDGWCPAAEDDSELANSVGVVRGRVSNQDDNQVTVERATLIRGAWYEPASFEHLRELTIAESRLARRSLRLECDPGMPDEGE